jgi:hypothetical protein
MKRRDQGISSAWSFLLGIALLTVVVPGVLIGPARAVRIIASAVSSTVMQGATPNSAQQAADPAPVVPGADLRTAEGVLVVDGVRHAVEVERPGDAHVLRFKHPEFAPFGPYTLLDLHADAVPVLLGDQLANWIAGRMGVAVPWSHLLQLELDGRSEGLHRMAERLVPEFEQYRHIHSETVPLFLPTNNDDPWRSVDAWTTMAATATEQALLADLLRVLNDTILPVGTRREHLERLVDVDGFIRLAAALDMVGASQHAGVRVALVLGPRTGRFYPVLDRTPLVPTEAAVEGGIKRLLAPFMAVQAWRTQRDELVRQALLDFHSNGAFHARMDELAKLVRPAPVVSGQRRRPLFSGTDPGLGAAELQWSAEDLRSRVVAHWDRLAAAQPVATHTGNSNNP